MQSHPHRAVDPTVLHSVVPVDELLFGVGAQLDLADGDRRDTSQLSRRGRRVERLLTGVLRIHEQSNQLDALNEAVRCACDCVGADWAVLRWSPPGEISQVVRWGSEGRNTRSVTLPLLAPRSNSVAAPFGVLQVGRAWPQDFDRYDRLLLAYTAHATVVAATNAGKLAQSEALSAGKDQILAMVSHDLRGPVAVVLAGATELLEGTADVPVVRAVAQGIARATGNMTRLLADLLDGAQGAAGTFSIATSPVAVREVFDEVELALAPAARARGISLSVADVPLGLHVLADRERLAQVFGNLLGNALKFTPRDGHAEVEVAVERGRAIFRVRDSGPGVLPEQRAHVFKRFWKGHGRHDGAGLGLFIARTIIAAHGGSLELEAHASGGAVFRFDLPIA